MTTLTQMQSLKKESVNWPLVFLTFVSLLLIIQLLMALDGGGVFFVLKNALNSGTSTLP